MKNDVIRLGDRSIPCRVTSGRVTVSFELPSSAMMVELDDGASYAQFKLTRRRDFSESESISIIECDPTEEGCWIVVAIARHENRTWALDVDPASFLATHRLNTTQLSSQDVSIAAAAGVGTLTLVLSGVYTLLFAPVLLPMVWIEGRKFLLRRRSRALSMRFFSYMDFMAQTVIGAKSRREFPGL